MSPADKTFIIANRHHYNTWKQARFIQQLDGATRNQMLAIIRRNFAPNYTTDLWCHTCVVNMLEFLYTQYDKWEVENNNTAT